MFLLVTPLEPESLLLGRDNTVLKSVRSLSLLVPSLWNVLEK